MRISGWSSDVCSNELPHPFVIVVDAARRPRGTITDGDIRRGILGGATLETPVTQVMNANPLVGRLDSPAAARQLLEQVPFVPMVDGAGALREIWRAAPNRSEEHTSEPQSL